MPKDDRKDDNIDSNDEENQNEVSEENKEQKSNEQTTNDAQTANESTPIKKPKEREIVKLNKDKDSNKKERRSSSHMPHYVTFAAVLVVGILIGAVAVPSITGGIISSTDSVNVPSATDIGSIAAGEKAASFVDSTLKLQSPTAVASVESIEESELAGYYLVNIEASIEGDSIIWPFLVSFDGNSMIQQDMIIDLNQKLPDSVDTPPADNVPSANQPALEPGSTFYNSGDEICTDEDGKPYVILFSTTWCPHCSWILETFENLVDEDFASQVNIQHWEIDINDETLTEEVETSVPPELMSLYAKYNPGGSIPT